MKEFVFVEFLFTRDEHLLQMAKLIQLGDDFEFVKTDYEYDVIEDLYTSMQDYVRVSGRINSMTASLIKLQNPALAGKMRISYITDELKNKYRK
jgi:hypothetical protein